MIIQKFIRINENIRAKEVRVIGPESEQLGVVMIKRALDLAEEKGLDLVEIAPTANPPVCRIMDYSKYKYDQEKKERKIKKNQKITHLKQMRLKPNIDEGDFQTKLKRIRAFLEKRDKVKINLFFRGREMAHKEIGRDILERMVQSLADIAKPEKNIAMEGRIMSVIMVPNSEKK